MVPGARFVKLLVNVPVPAPFDVFVDKPTVGLTFTLQHTPLAVMLPPPSLVTLPPPAAELSVIEEMVVVETVGMAILVVNVNLAPRVVPTTLVA